jgi:hypothetical protein
MCEAMRQERAFGSCPLDDRDADEAVIRLFNAKVRFLAWLWMLSLLQIRTEAQDFRRAWVFGAYSERVSRDVADAAVYLARTLFQ